MTPCDTFGHNWVVRPRKGRLVELCPTCGVVADDRYNPEEE